MSAIYHIGISGGKDSTALLLWALHRSGYPKNQIVCTFCDTGNEHQHTYDHIALISTLLHPVRILHPELDFFELAAKKKRFPSTKARFCTQELKMKPTKKFIDGLIRGGYEVINHSGVRADESFERAKLPERDPAYLSYYGVETYRPLLHWTLDDVLDMHNKFSFPLNKLYSYGCRRVGCFPCIMSSKAELRVIAKRAPEKIDLIREKEEVLQSSFFPPDKVPKRYRSRWVITRKGKIVEVPTVDDVVDWSRTGKGAKNYQMDFDDDLNYFDQGAPACGIGMCE